MTTGTRSLEFELNGVQVSVRIDDDELLIDLLRDELGLTSVKRSCDMEICGACTVLLDGRPFSSCTTLAYEADGRTVLTVEGMARDGELHPLQEAFARHGALQCGFCTPGFLLTLKAILDHSPAVTRPELIDELEGNICRCTGYFKILQAAESVMLAATGSQPESTSRTPEAGP